MVSPAVLDDFFSWNDVILHNIKVQLSDLIAQPLFVNRLPYCDFGDFLVQAMETEQNMVHQLLVLCLEQVLVVLKDVNDAFLGFLVVDSWRRCLSFAEASGVPCQVATRRCSRIHGEGTRRVQVRQQVLVLLGFAEVEDG